MVAPTDREESFTTRMGTPTQPEDCFLSPMIRTKEQRNGIPMLCYLGPALKPAVPPILLVQNLSSEAIAGSDITS